MPHPEGGLRREFQRGGTRCGRGTGQQGRGAGGRTERSGAQAVVRIVAQRDSPVLRLQVQVALQARLVREAQGPARVDRPAHAQGVARHHLVPALSDPLLHQAVHRIGTGDRQARIIGHVQAHDVAGIVGEARHAQAKPHRQVRAEGPGRLAFEPTGRQVDPIAQVAAGCFVQKPTVAEVGLVQLEAQGQFGRQASGQAEGAEGPVPVIAEVAVANRGLLRFQALLGG